MSKSIKFSNDIYLDSSGITHNKEKLSDILNNLIPTGTQVAYGGSTAPTGWLICDGSTISRTFYAKLFAVIGTSYGAGDGSTTFNLPNKKGRVSAGYDSANSKFNAIGKKLGEETHTLTVAEMPSHSHNLLGNEIGPNNKAETVPYGGSATGTNMVAIQASGNNQPHNNIQPTEVDNWIIKAF